MKREKTFIVVGPEVIENFSSGYEYAKRLRRVHEKVADRIDIAMWIFCKLSRNEENNRRLRNRFIKTVQDHIGIRCFDGEMTNCAWLIRENKSETALSRIMEIYHGL